MGRNTILVITLVVFSGIVAAAFLLNRPTLPTTEPFITGTITNVNNSRILVEDSRLSEGNKCWFAVTDRTAVFRGTAKADATDLTAGVKVRAWASGPVLESYPCQTGAGAIQIQSVP